jgi:hypothetical protein
MPEIGLLPFARVALDVARRILPAYRSRFSKHQFTQPQLLAILCLMRYEDWTFREAEVRLGEHRELRELLQLRSVPDYTTLYRFLRRWDDDTITRGVGETVRQIRQRWRARSIIPAKPRRGIPRGGIGYQMYRAFPQKEYGQRAKIETIFSVIKRKLSSRAPGRSLPVQIRQALLLGLTYNLYRLRHRLRLRGCQQSHLKSFVLEVFILKRL